MANKDGIVSIGFDYKKELDEVCATIEKELNNLGGDINLSDGIKKQMAEIKKMITDMKKDIGSSFDKITETKLDTRTFESFKKDVNKKIREVNKEVATLKEQFSALDGSANVNSIVQQFANLKKHVEDSNASISEFISNSEKLGKSVVISSNLNTGGLQDDVLEIKKLLTDLNKEDLDFGYSNKSTKELTNDLEGLVDKYYRITDLIDEMKSSMSGLDSTAQEYKNQEIQLSKLSLELLKCSAQMDDLFGAKNAEKINVNKIISIDELDDIFAHMQDISAKIKLEAKNIVESIELSNVAVKNVNNNTTSDLSNKSNIELHISTKQSTINKQLDEMIDNLQQRAANKPIIAPVKLRVDSEYEKTTKDASASALTENQINEARKDVESVVPGLEKAFNNSMRIATNKAVETAKESIKAVREFFETNPITVHLTVPDDEKAKIGKAILSEDGKTTVNISGEVDKERKSVKGLSEDLEKSQLLIKENAKNAKNLSLEKLVNSLSETMSQFSELKGIISSIQNMENTIARASGISSTNELVEQWSIVEKTIINATKLDGDFRKNANIGKIVSKYQKYIDMGGTNSLSDVDKIKDNESTINSILSKMKELKSQDVENDSIQKLSVDLDGVIAKFDELISTVKTATNALYKIIKQGNVSDLDKQWSSISNKFKSIADESDKINLSKQKTDIKELMDMYQKYINAGGTNSLMSLTNNVETLRKLDKEYQKLNQTQTVDNSSTIEKESESFKKVEKSVNSLTTAIGDTKVQAINIEATAMENAAEREIMAIRSILDNLDLIVSRLKDIKGIKLPKIEVKNVDVVEKAVESLANAGNKSNISSESQGDTTATISIGEKAKSIENAILELESKTGKSLAQVINNWDKLDESVKKDATDILSKVGLINENQELLFQIAGEGSNTKGNSGIAIITEEFAILQKQTDLSTQELQEYLDIINKLRSAGVNVANVFSAFNSTIGEQGKKGTFSAGYEIQERLNGSVAGTPIRSVSMENTDTAKKRIEELTRVLDLSDNQLLKFISDFEQVTAVLSSDPSNSGNFILNSSGIGMIDMGYVRNKNSNVSNTEILSGVFGSLLNAKGLSGAIDISPQIQDVVNKVALKIAQAAEQSGKFTREEILERVSTINENAGLFVSSSLSQLSQNTISTPSTSPIKDVFQGDKIDQATTSAKELDKTLEQVNIPTDSFDEVLSKLDLAKSELKEIVKITKQSVSDSEGKFHDSYTLKDKLGSTEIYGLNSNTEKGQLLRSNIVQYDSKNEEQDAKALLEVERQLTKEAEQQTSAQQKKWKAFQQEQANYEKTINEVNNAISKTDELLNKLQLHEKLDSQFLGLLDSVDELNSKLKAGEISVSDYNKSVKSLTSEYSKLVTVQQNRDMETYKQNAKATEQEAKAVKEVWDKNVKAIQDYMDAVTKLNNLKAQDKGTGTKSSQIALQEKNVEELKEKALDARAAITSMVNPHDVPIDTWRDWLDVMKKFDQASLGSAESVAKLEDALRNASESNLKSMKTSLQNYEGKLSDLSVKPDDAHRFPEYQAQLDSLNNAIQEYKTFVESLQGKGIIDESDINESDRLKANIEKLLKETKSFSSGDKGYTELGADKVLEKINSILEQNSAMSKKAKAQIKAYYNEILSGNPSRPLNEILDSVYKIVQAEREAGRAGQSWLEIFNTKKLHSFLGQAASMFSFYDIINVARQAGQAVIDLNTNITELAKVSEASASQIYDDFNSYADIAKEVGGTISDTISATADWSRNGYNIPDAKELAEVAMIYKNVGDGINIDQANEYLISTLRGFKLEAKDAMDIIDSINEVANNEPISSAGIGEALQRSAAAFNVANTSLQESIALVTSTNSVLQSPEKVGSMWTTVSARIRGAKTELEDAGLETDGMVESTSKLQSLIKGMTGFDILEDDQKTFKSIYDIIIGIGEEFQNLSGVDQAALLEALAGKRQSNALAATLNNIDLLKKAYGEATNAQGSAMAEQEKYQQSIQYSIDRTKASLEELANDFVSSDFLKGLIDSGDKLINLLDLLIDKFGVLGTTAIVGGGILGAKNIGRPKMFGLYKYADINMCSLGY